MVTYEQGRIDGRAEATHAANIAHEHIDGERLETINRLELILDDEIMKFSDICYKKLQNCSIQEIENTENIFVDEQIERFKNYLPIVGICCCDDGFLCEHRKRFIFTILKGL